jgi:hypothetical protein
MWGTDFPHQEGSGAQTLMAMRTLFWDVPVDECRMILGETAGSLYHFDLDALSAIAERIGPKIADVHERLEFDHRPGSAFAYL